MRKLGANSIVFLLLLNPFASMAKDSGKGVRLADIAKFNSTKFTEAGLLESRIKKYPQFYFDDDSAISHMNFLLEEPSVQKDGKVTVKIGSIVETAQGRTVNATRWGGSSQERFDTADNDNRHEIHLNTLTYDPNAKSINFELQDKEVIDIEDTRFKATIGLKERSLILEDQAYSDLKIVVPVGVGALDLGVSSPDTYQLMTPLYEGQNIDTDLNQVSWAHRDDKSYYKGKPFIRYRMNRSQYGGWSTIGLHIQQNRVFVRGFDSHGCMRLRPEDLDAVYRVLMNTENEDGLVLADILLKLDENELEHPMPKVNDRVKVVKNFGTRENPRTGKDRHGLTTTESRILTKADYLAIWERIEKDYELGKINIVRE